MIEIVCNQGVYSQQLSNVDILNKLKEIHEKIKRLNRTYSDPKFGRILNNRTQMFLDKNARKFINMTNSFSRKIASKGGASDETDKGSSNYVPASSKAKSSSTGPMKELEQEIEKFLASNDFQLTNQIDEIEKKNKAFKSKTGMSCI